MRLSQLPSCYPYLDRATKRSVSWFEMEFERWPFEPWAPVRRQTFVILNQVNRARKAAGLELVPTSCVRLKPDLPPLRRTGVRYCRRGGLTRITAGRRELVPELGPSNRRGSKYPFRHEQAHGGPWPLVPSSSLAFQARSRLVYAWASLGSRRIAWS